MTAYEMRISDWSSDVCSSDLRISWIVVAHLVATTVAAPVYGQLGDLLGRRLLLVIALVVFMTASLLCALSTSIEMLTAMRILQGLGGGGLLTLSQELVGEDVDRQSGGWGKVLSVRFDFRCRRFIKKK